MEALSPVGSTPAMPISPAPAAAAGAGGAASFVSSSSTSITRVGGLAGLTEGLAKLAGSSNPDDAMKLLVAMLVLQTLLGDDKEEKRDKLGGVLALSMLGQATAGEATLIESSSTLMVSQQGATAAYSHSFSGSTMSLTV